MKDELNLFYQIWDIPTQTLGNAASVSNLGFFTKFDLFLAKKKKNPMYTTLYVVTLLLLLLFLTLFVLVFLIIYFSNTHNYHNRERLQQLENIYAGIDAYNNKDYIQALNIFETLNAVINKDDLEFNSWLFYCYFNTGNYPKALEMLNFRMTRNTRIKILLCYYKLNNIQGLVDTIQKKFTEAEVYKNPLILAILCSALYKLNLPDVAIEKLSTYSTTGKLFNNDNCAFLYTLAKCKEATGDKSGAQADFKTIFAFNPNFMDVKDILASY